MCNPLAQRAEGFILSGIFDAWSYAWNHRQQTWE